MFCVIFEVQPKPARFDDYLSIAKSLKPVIEAIDGFVANDRFRSAPQPAKLLSLSDWRDEKALVRWRTVGEHHAAQERGRFEIFDDYHLRVGEVVADSATAVAHGQPFDETETGGAKVATITEFSGDAAIAPPAEALDAELFESIYEPGRMALLVWWRDLDAAARWKPALRDGVRHRVVRVIRDYGMHDRREAPQYYPPVQRGA